MEQGRILVLRCYAERSDVSCTAICIDLDIAAEGASMSEAKAILEEMVESYLETVMSLPEPDRKRLLTRKSPLSVRIKWFLRLMTALLFAFRNGPDREGYISHPVCPA